MQKQTILDKLFEKRLKIQEYINSHFDNANWYYVTLDKIRIYENQKEDLSYSKTLILDLETIL